MGDADHVAPIPDPSPQVFQANPFLPPIFMPPKDAEVVIDSAGRRVRVKFLRSITEFENLSVSQLRQIWYWNDVGSAIPNVSSESNSARQWPSAAQMFVTKFQRHFNGWCVPEFVNLQSYAQRSRDQKWHLDSLFPAQVTGVDHKCMPLGYQWGKSSCPDPKRVCDHPGCKDPLRKNVPVTSLSCGHSYHRICCTRSKVREAPRPGNEPGLGCIRVTPMNDNGEDVGTVCLLCFEGVRVAAAIEANKAKKLFESECDVVADEDADSDLQDDGEQDDPASWSSERCQEEIDRAVCRMRNIASTIPPL